MNKEICTHGRTVREGQKEDEIEKEKGKRERGWEKTERGREHGR